MDKRLERILPRVQKPARYVGGEYNAVKKDPAQVDTRIAFCFPDTYEIGMSNLGMRILYGAHEQHGRRVVPAGLCPLGRHGRGDAPGRDAPVCSGVRQSLSRTSTSWPSPWAMRWPFPPF